MNTQNFYMVLVSDSSMEYFRDNTAARFTTYSPQDVRLTGSWVVGLTEMQYPCSLMHIQDNDDRNVVFIVGDEIKDKKVEVPFKLPHGIYEDLDHLIRSLNHLPFVGKHILFEAKKQQHGFVYIQRICETSERCKNLVHVLRPSVKLLNILGFTPDSYVTRMGYAFPPAGKIVSDRPASLARALPDRMYIYCDLCGPYVTGDVQTSLLRIAPFDGTDYTYGSIRTVTFPSPDYIPLLQNGFRTIEIDMRDGKGQPIPFEYGPLNLTLHFKRMDT